MGTNTRKLRLALTVPMLVALLLSVFAAGGWAAGTHSATEPTWYYRGVVTDDTGTKMKHVTVVHDPLGLEGVTGNPKFMMWWGTSSPDQLFAATSDDGLSWSGTGTARTPLSVIFPSTTVPIYHPEVIYDRLGFEEKKSAGVVHFKMWFYDAGTENYNWIRYAESADGINWTVFEDSPCATAPGCTNPSNKNYLEFSGGSGNEMSVLYKRDGTGIVVNGVDQEYVGYQAMNNPVAISTDGAWFFRVDGQGGGPTDVCREMTIAGDDDLVNYRAWDDLPGAGDLTSWDSATGLSWNSPQAGNGPIVGASWSDFYGAMSVVVVGDRYYMYDTMDSDNYSVGLLIAPLVPPTKVWVDDDWTSQADVDAFDPSLIWQYDAFNSIQDGIDAVAGSTVNVLPGTYNEQVTVSKNNLTIRSDDGSAVDGTADTIISPPESSPGGIVISGDGNTLQGFKIVDPTALSHTTHEHRLVKVESDGNQVLSNWIVGLGCIKSKTGVLVRGESTTGDGVADSNLVQNNEVEQTCIALNSVSVASNRAARGTIVRSNNVHDNAWIAVSVDRSPDSLVEGNTMGPNNNSYAFYCQARETTQGSWASSAGSIIQDNVVQGNPEGARFEACGGVSVSCNTFTGNTVGIGLSVEAGNTGTPTINFNTISGNGTGLQNDTTETVNAEYNWWGHASGPTHASNPGGSGDTVSDGVDFDPWLSAPVGDVCPPPADDEGPITSNVVAIPNPVPVDTAIVLTANVDDSTTGGSSITSAEYHIDDGSFAAMNAQDGGFDEVSEDVEATLPAFVEAGIHELCVQGTDAAGNIGPQECILLVVYDPEGGFVTGGGWIWSPPGAYTAAPELEGKATFGFVSKYKKGVQTPEGQTEFVFKAADLNFHSNSYEWLVVAGSRAKFKGTGTINDEGEYKFMLTALDADINESDGFGVDRFRIRIWFEVDGNEIVVYDNGLGADDDDNAATEIGGGAIVIHTKK